MAAEGFWYIDQVLERPSPTISEKWLQLHPPNSGGTILIKMLSSMTPTIVKKDNELFIATGTPGGRAIVNTVMQIILNVVDHGMNAQAAVDAGRIHQQ